MKRVKFNSYDKPENKKDSIKLYNITSILLLDRGAFACNVTF